jgi:transposase
VHHIAIDLGSKHSQICVRAATGAIVDERRISTERIGTFLQHAPRPARVIIETCTEAFQVADVARELCLEVRVVPATMVKTLGVGSRGVKTDRRDAQILSEVSTRIDLPSVHIPTAASRELKSRLKARDALIASRTQLINSVRAYLRARRVRVRGGAKGFGRKVQDTAAELPDFVQAELDCLSVIHQQTLELDKQLAAMAKQNETARRLMTIPGIGPVCAMSFLAIIDDVSRFKDAHALQSYLGVTPGESSSSERQHRTGITKAGPPSLRRYLTQAAWSIRLRSKYDPMALWAEKIALRRGTAKANIALVRKLAGVMFAVWRSGSVYNAAASTRALPT